MRSEWLFRLVIEPRRLAGRYLIGNAVFLARCLRLRTRRARDATVETAPENLDPQDLAGRTTGRASD